MAQQAGLFARNDFGFRDLAINELPKYLKSTMVKLAGELAEDVELDGFAEWGPA